MRRGNCRTVAEGAVLGSGLVEEHGFIRDDPREFVAVSATDILVSAPQRKFSSLLMIKEGRLPLHAVVTFSTMRDVIFRELLAMNLFMAVFTLRGRRLEIDMDEVRLKVGRLVAVNASGGPMRA